MNISLCCPIKDKNDPLRYTIASWLYRDYIDEIVLLDWNSDTPLHTWLPLHLSSLMQRHKSPLRNWKERIRIYHIKKRHPWALSIATNIAIGLATHPVVMKIDADTVLVGHEEPNLPEDTYLDNRLDRDHENDSGLHGNFMIRVEDYWAVGGIDERYQSYGHEDTDLYNRLMRRMKRRNFARGTLYHLPHGDHSRTQHYANKDVQDSIKSNQRKEAGFGITRDPWGPHKARTKFSVSSSQDWYAELAIDDKSIFAPRRPTHAAPPDPKQDNP